MNKAQKVKMLLAYKDKTQADLAEILNTSPQNLSQKMRRNTLSDEDMEKIATALGVRWRVEFVLPDGKTI